MSRMTRLSVVSLVLAAVFATPGLARAHMGSTKYVEARVHDERVELAVHVEAIDATVALGLGAGSSAQLGRDLAEHEQLVTGWLSRGLVVASEAGPCPATAGEPTSTTRDGKPFISVSMVYTCPTSGGPLTLTDDTVYADDPDHQTFVTVRTADGEASAVLHSGTQHLRLERSPSPVQTASAFLREGGLHLATGYDHLLFLLSLVLIAGLGVRREGLRTALRDIGWIVTAFTVGHSISLCGAALGVVSLPSAWVEASIAGSIVLVAALNLLRPRTPSRTTRRNRAVIAGTFGLVHGFGFSSVLTEIGLGVEHRVLALASFNVGIELAQLAFVALTLVPIGLLARHAKYPRIVVQGGSLAIAAVGTVWLVERSLAAL
jgi:hypothetical protein